MNFRVLTSAILFCFFFVLCTTGTLNYLTAYNRTVSNLHTIFGFFFLIFVLIHLKCNWASLVRYIRREPEGQRGAGPELGLALVITSTVFLGIYFNSLPFRPINKAGENLRRTDELKKNVFTTIETNRSSIGLPISLDIHIGEDYHYLVESVLRSNSVILPLMSIWVEDLEENYLETLYVSQRATHEGFRARRPEALPVWWHTRDRKLGYDSNKTMRTDPIPDGITGATPLGHFSINSKVMSRSNKFRLYLEVNRSYDWNEYYTYDRFSDKALCDENCPNGQPSVIYAATIDTAELEELYLMKPVGHGSYSGEDGRIYPDLSTLTTALNMLKRIVVHVGPR